jgi:hypothetical protein
VDTELVMPVMRYMHKMGERSGSSEESVHAQSDPGQFLYKLPVASGISFPVASGTTSQPKSGLSVSTGRWQLR